MSSNVSSTSLPEGWASKNSRTGAIFYVNIYTKKPQWNKPTAPARNPADAPGAETISCSHILVKHNSSRRPASWRSENIERTRGEALDMINNFREQILNSQIAFKDVASAFSDCSSAKRNGDLGSFTRGQMQKAFEIVAFKLKVGQLSRPVETRSGIHLILRTA